MNKTTKKGKELGRKHLDQIALKGDRWKSRNIPAYIREHLMVPYYITDVGRATELYVIQLPILPGEKVHFILYARFNLDEAT